MRKFLLAFFCSLFLFLLVGVPLRLLGFIVSAGIESVCYAILTYLFLKKLSLGRTQVWVMAGFLILGRTIVEIPLRIMDFEHSLISLPSTSIVCLTILLVSLVFILRKKSVLLISLLIWGYCVIIGHRRLLEYIAWGGPLQANVSEFVVNTPEGRVSLGSLDSEYIMLDFWISRCGVCFKQFPNLQSLFDKTNGDVTIASVFVPYLKDEQEMDGKSILEKCGYTFPVWSVSSTDTLLKVLQIEKYPAVILLDKERNVVFKGSLEFAKNKMEDVID